MGRKAIQIVYVFLMSFLHLSGQDVTFSQFFSSPTFVNPAFVGNLEQSRLSLNYRNHVPAQQTQYITYAAYYDQYINMLKGGIGGHFFIDQAGAFSQINLGVANSFTIKLNRNYYLKSGFQYDFFQLRLNNEELIFEDQVEAIPTLNSKIRFDFSAGFILYDDDKFIGFKVAHLLEPNLSFEDIAGKVYNLKRTFSFHAGWDFPIEYYTMRRYEMSIAPVLIYYKQADYNLILAGSNINFLNYTIGLLVRNNFALQSNSLIFLMGVRLSSYKLAYSYDWALSKYRYANFGAHEISFSYIFETKDKKKKYKAIKCPSF